MKIQIGTTEISEKDIVSIDGNYADKISILIKNIHKQKYLEILMFILMTINSFILIFQSIMNILNVD